MQYNENIYYQLFLNSKELQKNYGYSFILDNKLAQFVDCNKDSWHISLHKCIIFFNCAHLIISEFFVTFQGFSNRISK